MLISLSVTWLSVIPQVIYALIGPSVSCGDSHVLGLVALEGWGGSPRAQAVWGPSAALGAPAGVPRAVAGRLGGRAPRSSLGSRESSVSLPKPLSVPFYVPSHSEGLGSFPLRHSLRFALTPRDRAVFG